MLTRQQKAGITRRNMLTRKEKKWADKVAGGQSATRAALEVYDTESYNTAGTIAHANLHKPKVIQYLEDHESLAAGRIVELIRSSSEAIALNASKDLLDRTQGKPTQKIEKQSRVLHLHLGFSNRKIEKQQ